MKKYIMLHVVGGECHGEKKVEQGMGMESTGGRLQFQMWWLGWSPLEDNVWAQMWRGLGLALWTWGESCSRQGNKLIWRLSGGSMLAIFKDQQEDRQGWWGVREEEVRSEAWRACCGLGVVMGDRSQEGLEVSVKDFGFDSE